MEAIDYDPFSPISNPTLYAKAHGTFLTYDKEQTTTDQGTAARGPSKRGKMTIVPTNHRPVIRIRTLSQGLMLAEEWGFHIEKMKPWEKKTRVIPTCPTERRVPIDREDAHARGGPGHPYLGNPSGRSRPPPVRVSAGGSPIARHQITPELIARSEALGIDLPPVGTEIEVTEQVAHELAEQIAAAEVDDPRSGDKVAALAALLGTTIENTHGKSWQGKNSNATQYEAPADAKPVKLPGM